MKLENFRRFLVFYSCFQDRAMNNARGGVTSHIVRFEVVVNTNLAFFKNWTAKFRDENDVT
jgi:hypothetical protein